MNNYKRKLLTLCGLLVTPVLVTAQTADASELTPSTETGVTDASISGSETRPVAEQALPVASSGAAAISEVSITSDSVVTDAASTDLTPLSSGSDAVAVLPSEPEKPKDTLTVDFPDEEIRNILRNVADLFELNLVVPDTLQGRTSIKLGNVTWRQIFKVVLTPVGYTFIEDANIIKVVTIDSLAQEPLATEVFVLNYARAEEIEPSIKPLVDAAAGGRVLVDKRINALIISERPSRMEKITPVLESLDKATEQVMIESKFIEVNDTDIKNLGINWSSLNSYQVGYSPTNLLLAQSDRNNLGTGTGGVTEGVDPTTAGIGYGAVLSGPQFNVALRALQTSNDSRVVSNPTIVTLNNTAAEINVGEEYPIPSYTYNAERGSFDISGFEYKPIGVLLKVTPQVNAQGFIRLNLEPEISVRGDPVSFGGASAVDIPIIRTRKTKTQVSMKDGHTLAIGGLIDSTSQKGETRVPVLGSIPGLGRLFRSDSSDASRRNLLIFITSKVVSAETAPVQDIFSAEQVHAADLRRSDLPGIRRADDEGLFKPEKMPEGLPPGTK